MKQGCIHLYCGDGKGKTTASMGLAVRAAGNGLNVYIVQFLKSRPTGEITILSALPNVTVVRGKKCTKFSWDMDDAEKSDAKAFNDNALREAINTANAQQCDLLLLDEAVGSCACGLLDADLLLDFMKSKPAALELVITGRDPSQPMVDAADYVTEMKKIKHPFDQGIPSRKGVEF